MLPELICRLIRATVDKIDGIRFPSGESVNFAGWDAHLLCADEVPPFVPLGGSVWELTTDKGVPTNPKNQMGQPAVPFLLLRSRVFINRLCTLKH